MKWGNPDNEGLKKFLVEEKNFSENRLENAMKRIESSKSMTSQQRLENFFQVKSVTKSTTATGGKRKVFYLIK